MPTKIIPLLLECEAVAEETSAREVNTMLRAGSRLLPVINARARAGGSPVYIVARPRAGSSLPNTRGPAQAV